MGISLCNISKSYKKIKAVHDISFKVQPGELFGLIGNDGAGKTTILLSDEGKALVAGFDV